jgi:diguanylate cyclase (GGDEF)-like protein/PAS domain S-box-containing protein
VRRDSVLVVDDEPQVLMALDDILSDTFTVLKTECAEHALSVARDRDDIAVVVTDQRMPKTQGDQLVAMLAGFSDATRILLTGYADINAVIRAVNEGHIFAYVTKPWHVDDLLYKVCKAAERFHMVKELSRERQMLHDLMDNVPDGIFFKDKDLRFVRVNRAHAALVHDGTPEELVGKHLRDIRPGDAELVRVEEDERRVLEGAPAVDAVRTDDVGGNRRWLSESKGAILNAAGQPIGLVGITRDITDRKLQQDRIARLTRIQAISSGINSTIAQASDRMALLEESCRIAVQIGKLDRAVVFGWEATEDPQMLAAYPPDSGDAARIGELLRARREAEGPPSSGLRTTNPLVITNPELAGGPTLADGGTLAIFALPMSNDGSAAFCLMSGRRDFFDAEEVELLKEMMDKIAFGLAHISTARRLDFLAYHDELTGLPKRSLFADRLNQLIAESRGSESHVAILAVNIGRFRQINETLGRGAGDQLLAAIATRLRASVGDRDTLARIDSDTFAVLTSGTESKITELIEGAILSALKKSFNVMGTEVRVATKVGVAFFPSDGGTADQLIAHAEVALESAKASSTTHAFYAPGMQQRASGRLTLEMRLRRAVEAEEFQLYYQPKVDLRTGMVVGLEALLRWRDAELGFVSPLDFIPLLEETGLIHEVGLWVLTQANAQHAAWKIAGFRPPRIAVNVSAIQLAGSDLEQILRACPGSSESVDIEITESVFVSDLEGSIAKLKVARELGLRVAIDDFGTGYSSLGYLTRLPIDALKIDRSFIVNMTTSPQETTIVTTIISLAHAMDLKVIAEGVETADQARLLRLFKCDQIQGYLVSRPQPAQQVQELLAKHFSFTEKAS